LYDDAFQYFVLHALQHAPENASVDMAKLHVNGKHHALNSVSKEEDEQRDFLFVQLSLMSFENFHIIPLQWDFFYFWFICIL